ncbi:MAG: hypothetical protein HY204_00960 [Nitrospirae bacterium]|nr:hypothetical protein [Nitrospirota bacterium]
METTVGPKRTAIFVSRGMGRPRFFLIFSWLLLTGCSVHGIVPTRLTYTYPPAEPMAYETDAGFGAIAFIDGRAFDLYLPYFNRDVKGRPKRFVFLPVDPSNVQWLGKPAGGARDPDIEAHFALDAEEVKNKSGDALVQLNRGALVITFPAKDEYQGLAGQTLWLVPSVGWDQVVHFRGLYVTRPSDLPESLGFQFSREAEAP